MSLITPFPEAESPALQRFALERPDEIAALLGELRDRQTLVTLYYDHSAGFTVGSVLDVDAARETVILDCVGDDDAQRSIARARDLVVVAFLDGTKIQFTLPAAEPAEFQGRAAIRLRLPSRVLRIQRRSAPRRQPPGGRPAVCRVPVPDSPEHYESVRVLDISLGGLAVVATPRLYQLLRDQVLGPCYLDLPEFGQIGVALRVRYLEACPGEDGERRCGCEFVELGDGARRSLQRYLERLEATRPTGGNRHAA
ncbi:MAG TPA: flagellar brake protein [Burkholderiaceae bacterium]|nr:flagellar brake protein [Burkholderiaceae bacterium]